MSSSQPQFRQVTHFICRLRYAVTNARLLRSTGCPSPPRRRPLHFTNRALVTSLHGAGPQERRASVCGSAAGGARRLRFARRLSPPSAPLSPPPDRRPKPDAYFPRAPPRPPPPPSNHAPARRSRPGGTPPAPWGGWMGGGASAWSIASTMGRRARAIWAPTPWLGRKVSMSYIGCIAEPRADREPDVNCLGNDCQDRGTRVSSRRRRACRVA